MNTAKTVFAFSALMLAASLAVAGDVTTDVNIIIEDGTGGESVRLNLDGASLGFDLQNMQEGEIQSIVDESGRPILFTREADGIRIDVDGKTINIPSIGDGNHMEWISVGDGLVNTDVNVRVMRHGGDMTGTTILSAKAIDAATREEIRSLLANSGHDGEVDFIESGGSGGRLHKMIVIDRVATTE